MPLVVNGETVDDSVLELERQALRVRFLQMPAEQRQQHGLDAATIEQRARDWSRENVIERILLRQEALKDNEPITVEAVSEAIEALKKQHGSEQFSRAYPDEQLARKQMEDNLRVERLIGKITAKIAPPKMSDVAEYFRKHRSQLQVPEAVRAAHIVKHVNEQRDEKTAEAEIRAAEEELKAGGSFAEVADRHSDCPGNGGDLGFFARGVMVDRFDEVVFAMDAGDVSPVFRSELGYHIVRLIDRQDARPATLPEVEERIRAELKRQKDTRAVESYVDRLRAKADIRDVAAEAPVAAQS